MKIFNQIYTYIHLKIGDEKKNPSFVTHHISTHCHQGKIASIIGYKIAYDCISVHTLRVVGPGG